MLMCLDCKLRRTVVEKWLAVDGIGVRGDESLLEIIILRGKPLKEWLPYRVLGGYWDYPIKWLLLSRTGKGDSLIID